MLIMIHLWVGTIHFILVHYRLLTDQLITFSAMLTYETTNYFHIISWINLARLKKAD